MNHFLTVISLFTLLITSNYSMGLAQESDKGCKPLSVYHDKVLAIPSGRWIELTDIQRAYLAGIYSMNPSTPGVEMPMGDKAAMAQTGKDSEGGIVFFIDGDKICNPMVVSEEIIKNIKDIEQGNIHHEGKDN